jgi:hypothetical protein
MKRMIDTLIYIGLWIALYLGMGVAIGIKLERIGAIETVNASLEGKMDENEKQIIINTAIIIMMIIWPLLALYSITLVIKQRK